MFWSARWFMENCWTCWVFSCSSKLAFPISISLSPCPTLNQQLTTCPLNKFTWESQSDLAECLAGPALNKSLIYCTWLHWLWLKGWMWSSVMQINAACMCADACTGLFCVCEREKESIPKCKLRVSSLRNAATKTQEISQSATVERWRCWPAACI